MKLLYVFPHPDDESFGPMPAMIAQREAGHEVYLLTLTRGEATSQRHKYGYTAEEMGEVRSRELTCAAEVAGIDGLEILDFPDGQLSELDPRELENAIGRHIEKLSPDILVTYAVHGISGFHDHLVSHAVVKRLYCELRDAGTIPLERLAFFTVFDPIQPSGSSIRLEASKEEAIDCITETHPTAVDLTQEALDCYETYQEVIETTNIREQVRGNVYFEIFQENHTPPLDDLTDGL